MQVENFNKTPPPEEEQHVVKGVAAAAYIPPKGFEGSSQPGAGQHANDRSLDGATPQERITKVAAGLPDNVKDDINGLVKSSAGDLMSGKWSEASKQGWKKLVQDMKAGGLPDSELGTALNQIGSALNELAAKEGAPNHVGIAGIQNQDGTADYYMLLNNKTNGLQNGLDAGMGHETDTVVKAGSTGDRKPGVPI